MAVADWLTGIMRKTINSVNIAEIYVVTFNHHFLDRNTLRNTENTGRRNVLHELVYPAKLVLQKSL